MTHADPASYSGAIPLQPPAGAGIWHAPYLLTTIGAVALIFLAAMQSLAVTTVMPTVAADLGGTELYAVAFSGSFATSIIGMVASGAWSDRKSPAQAMWCAVIAFAAGLVVCAAAPSMLILVLGRLVMGLGSGGLVVALYVIVARVYPPNLHGRVMAAFAAAWVVPSLVGPAGAGAVTEFLHWRWVFAGVAVLAAGAFAMLASRLRTLDLSASHPDTSPIAGRLALSFVVAIGLLGVSLAGEAPGGMTSSILLAAAGFVIVIIAMRPLVPRGTFLARRGLPSVILRVGDLSAVPPAAALRFLADLGGSRPHGRCDHLGTRIRVVGASRCPDRQCATRGGRLRSTRIGCRRARRLGLARPAGVGADRVLGTRILRDGHAVPAHDGAVARILDDAQPGLQLVGGPDLGRRRDLELDGRHGARVRRRARCLGVPRRLRDRRRHRAGRARPWAAAGARRGARTTRLTSIDIR
jgi:MFS family permease